MRRLALVCALGLFPVTSCGERDKDAPAGAAGSGGAAAPDAGADAGSPDGGALLPPDCEPGVAGADLAAALAGRVRAGRITAEDQLIRGESAEGRVGDLKLENGQVSFVLQDIRVGDNYVPFAGGVLDATFGGERFDVIDEFAPIVTIRAFDARCVTILDSGESGRAVIRYRGSDGAIDLIRGFIGFSPVARGLHMSTDYILERDKSYLEIVTTVTNPNDEAEDFELGDFVMLSDDGVDPFAVPAGFARSRNAGLVEVAGSAGEHTHAAIGMFADDAPLNLFLSGALGIDSDRTIYGTVQKTVRAAKGETVTIRRFLALGRDGDAITRAYYAVRRVPITTLRGTVGDGAGPVVGARVHVLGTEAAPTFVTYGTTDAQGRFEIAVPAGRPTYRLIATGQGTNEEALVPGAPGVGGAFANGHAKSAPVEVTTASGAEVALVLGQPGRVDLTIRDQDGQPSRAKVVFLYAGEAPAIDDVINERRPYRNTEKIFWTVDGRVQGALEPGTYDLWVVRGFRYEADVRRGVTVAPGQTLTLDDLVVRRVVDSAGWLQIDTHVHGAPSLHGEATEDERLVTNIAEDLDLFVSTDHDRLVDYRPGIARLGLGTMLQTFIGEEISTAERGHFNPYPSRIQAALPNGGAVDWWSSKWQTTGDIFRYAHETLGAPIVQINHGAGIGGFFDYAALDRASGIPVFPDYYSDDFQVMELINGKGPGNWEEETEIWYGYLNRGRRIVAVGVSDSHHKVPEPGYGRSFVQLASPVGAVGEDEFVAAMLGGRVIVSGGPLPTLTAPDGKGIGDTLEPAAGAPVTLQAVVQAPSWMPLDRAQLIVNGRVEREWDLRNATAPRWLDEAVTVMPAGDAWIALRVDGSRSLGPVYPGAAPFAITNPIFVTPR